MKEKNQVELKQEEAFNFLKDNIFFFQLLLYYNMSKLNVLIAGSTGYIGVQLIKLLMKHKHVNIKYLCGSSSIGKKISYYEKSLRSKKLPKIIKFNKKLLNNIDVIFTALPNGEAQKISKSLLKKNTLIDLSADFRLRKARDFEKWYKIKHKAKNLIKKAFIHCQKLQFQKLRNIQLFLLLVAIQLQFYFH